MIVVTVASRKITETARPMKLAHRSPGRGEDMMLDSRLGVDCELRASCEVFAGRRSQVAAALRHGCLDDLVVLLDLLHDVETLRDAAEDSVHAIEVLRVLLAEHH